MMKIHGIQVIEGKEHNELRGYCDDYELWYKFPKQFKLEPRADAFLAACLIPAMSIGEDIEILDDSPISPHLLKSVKQIQEVFAGWGPYFGKNLRLISVTGGSKEPATTINDSVVSFFSGGADGTYTYLKNEKSIDCLLFAKGIDMQLSNQNAYDYALSKNNEFLEPRGKEIFPFETNVRYIGHEYKLSWNICFGGGLSSIALACGVSQCYIASGLSYQDLYPHGSSFMTDHLWSNEATKIVHDGAEATRLQKIAYIGRENAAINILRVCWHDKGYNCGECEKCLRTMATLRALNLKTTTFPEISDSFVNNKIGKIKLYEEYVEAYWHENLEAAEKANDQVLVRAINSILKRVERRKLLHLIDSNLFSGNLKKFKNRLRNAR